MTMQITKFDRDSSDQFLKDFTEHMESFLTARGLTRKPTRATYATDGTSLKFRLEVFTAGGDETAARKDFECNCVLYGLKPEDFGREFEHSGTRYTVAGLRPRSKKKPIIIRRVSDNGEFVASDSLVCKALGREPVYTLTRPAAAAGGGR